MRHRIERIENTQELEGSSRYSPEGYTAWATLILRNRGIGLKLRVTDVPLAVQAATETDTRYCTPDIGEACRLLDEDSLRIGHYHSLGYREQAFLEGLALWRAQEEERRRVQRMIDTGFTAIALADKSRESGLSDFWKKYRELKDQSSSESLEA